MGNKLPAVAAGALWRPEVPNDHIPLDTAAWFAWLAATTTTSFSYPVFDPACGYIVGYMTVRKEHRRGGSSYWWAFRRQGKRVRKVYLGRSAQLTQARLAQIAGTFHAAAQASG